VKLLLALTQRIANISVKECKVCISFVNPLARARVRDHMTRRACLLALAASPLLPKSWDQPVFPAWPASFVEKMLSDSPWARPFTAKFESHAGSVISRANFYQIPGWPRSSSSSGTGVRTEAYLTIRWASALPVRQALALMEYGKGGLDHPKALELLNQTPEDYVIDIAGFPATLIGERSPQLERELRKTARLWIPGRKPLAPTDAYVPEYGMHLQATLRFPRVVGLEATDDPIELIARTPWFGMQQKFKPKTMLYRESLEL
jgi:hypothetical protein